MSESPAAIPAGARMWTLVFAGLAALLSGIGLGRFAYAALVPGMIGEGHVNLAGAGYLAAANVTGYLVGAATGGRVSKGMGLSRALRLAMVGTSLSLLACAWPIALPWLIGARFIAGVTGGYLMVLAAPSILANVPASRRGVAGGVLFTGIGLGIMFSGAIVPLLADAGTAPAWLALGVLAGCLTIATWNAWPSQAPAATVADRSLASSGYARPQLSLLAFAYGCDAIGFVPHTVFWVDFIARELEYGIGMAGLQWTLFGVGAAAGPTVMGLVAQRIGFARAFSTALMIKAVAILLPVLSGSIPALVVSSMLVGALTPATASLAAGRLTELLAVDKRQQAWARLTMLFAVVQAVGAVALARVADASGELIGLFLLGSVMLFIGALLAEWHRRSASL